MTRRAAAIVAVLTLFVGNVAVCAGWQASPEARMSCCTSGTSCPMHKSAARSTGSKHTISQAQADSCCAAASARTQSATSRPTFVPLNTMALFVPAAPIVLAAVPALRQWRALAPLPLSPVPKHLLLSVLLI